MANAPSSAVTVTLDDSAGTPRVITGFVLTMGALKITNKTQPSTGLGDTWERKLANGIRAGEKVGLTGYVDNTADTGTWAVMLVTDADAVPGFTRSLSVLIMSGHTFTAETILEDAAIEAKVGLCEYKSTLGPTGVCAWS